MSITSSSSDSNVDNEFAGESKTLGIVLSRKPASHDSTPVDFQEMINDPAALIYGNGGFRRSKQFMGSDEYGGPSER